MTPKEGGRKQAQSSTAKASPPNPARRKQAGPVVPPSKIRAEERARAKEQAAAAEKAAHPEWTHDWVTIGVGAGVTLAALILYVLTTAHNVIAGDTPDFLIASSTLGVAHAPGYPSLTMLGYLFSLLPLGSTAFRIDLLAAVCSAASVAVLYAIIWRLTSVRVAAAAGGLILAFTPLFWRWSLQMETFPFDNLLALLIIFFIVRWHQRPTEQKYLLAAAFTFGIGMTNQQTIVFVAPAILFVLILHRRQILRQPSIIGYAALAIVAGLVPYIYVPLASLGHSAANWDYVHSTSAFVRLVKRSDYGGLTPSDAGGSSNLLVRMAYMGRSFGIVLGIATIVGAIRAYLKYRWFFWFTLIAFLFTAFGFLLFTNLNPSVSDSLFVMQRFFLLPLVVIAPLAGLAVEWLGDVLAHRLPSLSLERATAVVAGVAILASLVVVGVNYSTLNVSNDNVTGNYARDVVDNLPQHTILFATGDESDLPLLYITNVEKVRPDVTVIVSPTLAAPWYWELLRHNHQLHVPAVVNTLNIIRANPGRPVAFIGDPPDKTIDGKYYLYPDGLVYYLEPEATNIAVTQEISANMAQLSHLHIPPYSAIKPDSFEDVILNHYGSIYAHIAEAYEREGMDAQADDWYRKARVVDPPAVKQLHPSH